MVMLALVTLSALALSRPGRPAEYVVGLDVAPDSSLRREIRALYGPRRSPRAVAGHEFGCVHRGSPTIPPGYCGCRR